MFHDSASVIDNRIRNTKFSRSSRGPARGSNARSPSAARIARAQRRSCPTAVMAPRAGAESSAEESARTHGEHDDEDHEPDDLAIRAAERRRARRLRDAQHEAADE